MEQAKEACRSSYEDVLNCCEPDPYGNPRKAKMKTELMVSLVMVNSDEADEARMNPENEREYQLSRSLSHLEEVKIQSFFETHSIVLVRGLPGSGKSKFCHFVIREWIFSRLWKGVYDFVFFVNAPLLVRWFARGKFSVEEALKDRYPDVFRTVSFNELNKSSCLIIIDAIDECNVEQICSGKKCTSNEELIAQLIVSTEKFKRIILGRPYACDKLRRTLLKDRSFKFVEIVGFASDQLQLYVRKFCQPPVTAQFGDVWKRITENTSLFNLCHLPVFANIVCSILTKDSNLDAKIETVTQIYVYAYAVFTTRHLKEPSEETVDISCFYDLFNDEKCTETLLKLSELALRNICAGNFFLEVKDFLIAGAEYTFASPIFSDGKKFLRFSHLTLMEFFAAVHLLKNREKLDKTLIENHHLRGVLPMLFGLWGGAVENSDSPEIICDFVQALMRRFKIPPIVKHPLEGEMGMLVYDIDRSHHLYRNVIFEFRNRLLIKQASVFRDNDAMLVVSHHHEMERLFFFMKNVIHEEGRRIRRLVIQPTDGQISVSEVLQLHESISAIDNKLNELRLWKFSVNEEEMEHLSSFLCMIRRVSLYTIQPISGTCGMIFVARIREAISNNTLQLKELTMHDCQVDPDVGAELKQIVEFVYISER